MINEIKRTMPASRIGKTEPGKTLFFPRRSQYKPNCLKTNPIKRILTFSKSNLRSLTKSFNLSLYF